MRLALGSCLDFDAERACVAAHDGVLVPLCVLLLQEELATTSAAVRVTLLLWSRGERFD